MFEGYKPPTTHCRHFTQADMNIFKFNFIYKALFLLKVISRCFTCKVNGDEVCIITF